MDKIDVYYKLEWFIQLFKLLGIHFSINLEEMLKLNYLAALKQCDKLLNSWKKQNHTPFSKIIVIKTFISSKFNHIFSSIPSPAVHFFSKLLQNKLYMGQ